MNLARDRKESQARFIVGNIQQTIRGRFGRAVREQRKRIGITQADLADATGLNRSYISEVECGRESISLERAERIARALSVDLSFLVKKD